MEVDGDGETMAKKKIPVPDVARMVSAWALFTAGVFLVSFALAYHHLPCDLVCNCVQPTDITWMVSCAASQAAAAALALLLPGRHRCVRRALVYLVLTLAIVVHFVLMMAAESHNIVMIYWTIFFMAGDYASVLALMLGGEED
ncbi:hypothetical protein CFC21_064092 [Triticum aestivum]|uniref:Uncharacterized protein n=2 Tax=Triticum aestivum TaxID=4565 RepID=A0A9R1GZN8_WHEAT|nr:hypothetical protein CFC21_064092 [Triticum aestivum]